MNKKRNSRRDAIVASIESRQRFTKPRPRQRGLWTREFKIPTSTAKPRGIPILILPAYYEEPIPKIRADKERFGLSLTNFFYQYGKHTARIGDRLLTTFLCSAGLDIDNPQPCCGCDYTIANKDLKGPSIDVTDRYVFNVYVLDYFHKVPAVDNNGKALTDSDGKQLFDDIICEGHSCSYCRDGLPKVFGNHRYVDFGKGYFDKIIEDNSATETFCLCGGEITVASLVCPSCGSMLGLEYYSKGINGVQLIKCPECNNIVLPTPIFSCDSCETPQPQGTWPEQGRYPTVVWVNRTDDSPYTLSIVTRKPANKFKIPDTGEVLLTLNNGEQIWHPSIQQAIANPIDFPKLLNPLNFKNPEKYLETQAQIIQAKVSTTYQNPYGPKNYEDYQR